MKKYLIINADDLGLSKEINDGIMDAHRNGIATSASLMTNQEYFSDVLPAIEQNPNLGVGIHLNILRGRPISQLEYLVDSRGNFQGNIALLTLKFLLNPKKTTEEVSREFDAQIKKAVDAGVKITHLDTEKHSHIFPFIFKIVINLAKQYNIKSIRFPFEKMTSAKNVSPRQWLKILFSNLFYKKCLSMIKQSGLSYPDFFYGISLSERFSVNNLKELVDNLQPGVSELSCHPAYKMPASSSFIDKSRDTELETLTNPVLLSYIKEKEIVLTSFKVFNN